MRTYRVRSPNGTTHLYNTVHFRNIGDEIDVSGPCFGAQSETCAIVDRRSVMLTCLVCISPEERYDRR